MKYQDNGYKKIIEELKTIFGSSSDETWVLSDEDIREIESLYNSYLLEENHLENSDQQQKEEDEDNRED
ncbi:MAG: hypothetical protein QXF12_01695 [Candidatus Aenigmatarchaeota archaeon]